ncbi:hypothetical protein T07_13762 [Trichinella nelsoni]|uniref:Uncharacterized protein n=1 Tax=Trichinella nelsoni TaxID=6336 RepID=A0A0V0S021_9BILA|nr:hypothetical protein T07_13762 [Trichinella nelsoni]
MFLTLPHTQKESHLPRFSSLVLLRAVRDLRTFNDATICHVSQTNECTLTDDKTPLWRSLFA